MHTFFHGWRRKVGCVTLLMACMLMGMWMRSRVISDSLRTVTETSLDAFSSGDGGLWWVTNELEIRGSGNLLGFPLGWISEPLDQRESLRLAYWGLNLDMDSQCRERGVFGFRFIACNTDSIDYTRKLRGAAWRIPYWGIVVPLTLLSSYLILGKPVQTSKANNPGISFSRRHKGTERDQNNPTDNADLSSVSL